MFSVFRTTAGLGKDLYPGDARDNDFSKDALSPTGHPQMGKVIFLFPSVKSILSFFI
jgi:hypothetical protein